MVKFLYGRFSAFRFAVATNVWVATLSIAASSFASALDDIYESSFAQRNYMEFTSHVSSTDDHDTVDDRMNLMEPSTSRIESNHDNSTKESILFQDQVLQNFMAGGIRYQDHIIDLVVEQTEDTQTAPSSNQTDLPLADNSTNSNYKTDLKIFQRVAKNDIVNDPYHILPRRKRPSTIKESPTLRLPKPVMVVGFPKAGTSSIFSFFHCSGLRSMHWYCCGDQTDPQMGGPQLMSGCILRNLAYNYPPLYKCGNYEVFAEMNGPRKFMLNQTGHKGYLLDNGTYDFDGPGSRILLPQHHYLDQIHEEYPDATFILNLRPVRAWVASVLRMGTELATQMVNEYYMQSQGTMRVPTNDDELTDFLSDTFIQHSIMIREFVKQHPSHALIEVDISDIRAGEILADAFGLNATCWRHVNPSPLKVKG